jgi:hypothetical protein
MSALVINSGDTRLAFTDTGTGQLACSATPALTRVEADRLVNLLVQASAALWQERTKLFEYDYAHRQWVTP